jgi:hypothetical protein
VDVVRRPDSSVCTGGCVTKNEASRNFLWSTAAAILDALAYRNMSIERMEAVLGWPTGRLSGFLACAVYDTLSDADTLTLRQLSDIFWELDMRIRIEIRQIPDDAPTPPEPSE